MPDLQQSDNANDKIQLNLDVVPKKKILHDIFVALIVIALICALFYFISKLSSGFNSHKTDQKTIDSLDKVVQGKNIVIDSISKINIEISARVVLEDSIKSANQRKIKTNTDAYKKKIAAVDTMQPDKLALFFANRYK